MLSAAAAAADKPVHASPTVFKKINSRINDPNIEKIFALSDIHGDPDDLIIQLRDCAKVIRKRDPRKFNAEIYDTDLTKYFNVDLDEIEVDLLYGGEIKQNSTGTYDYEYDWGYEWCGGNAIVVIVGDILDLFRRSTTKTIPSININTQLPFEYEQIELKIIKFLNVLDEQARLVGGSIIKLIGNHEIMNFFGDNKYKSYYENYIKTTKTEHKRLTEDYDDCIHKYNVETKSYEERNNQYKEDEATDPHNEDKEFQAYLDTQRKELAQSLDIISSLNIQIHETLQKIADLDAKIKKQDETILTYDFTVEQYISPYMLSKEKNYYKKQSRLEIFNYGKYGYKLFMEQGALTLLECNTNIFVHGQLVGMSFAEHEKFNKWFSLCFDDVLQPNKLVDIDLSDIIELAWSEKKSYLWMRDYGSDENIDTRFGNNHDFCGDVQNHLISYCGNNDECNNYRIIIGHCPQYYSTTFDERNITFKTIMDENTREILTLPTHSGMPDLANNIVFGITMECPVSADADADRYNIYRLDCGHSRSFDTDITDIQNLSDYKKYFLSRTPQLLVIEADDKKIKIIRSSLKNTIIHQPRPYYDVYPRMRQIKEQIVPPSKQLGDMSVSGASGASGASAASTIQSQPKTGGMYKKNNKIFYMILKNRYKN